MRRRILTIGTSGLVVDPSPQTIGRETEAEEDEDDALLPRTGRRTARGGPARAPESWGMRSGTGRVRRANPAGARRRRSGWSPPEGLSGQAGLELAETIVDKIRGTVNKVTSREAGREQKAEKPTQGRLAFLLATARAETAARMSPPAATPGPSRDPPDHDRAGFVRHRRRLRGDLRAAPGDVHGLGEREVARWMEGKGRGG